MPEIDLSLLMYGLAVGLAAAAIAGTLAGLAGVGGGLIYAPVFYALMPGDSHGAAMPVFASLVAVILTGFFSARAHWRLGHINIQIAKRLLPGLIVGAGLGLWCTLHLPEVCVLLALAALDAWIAFDYGRKPKHASAGALSLSILPGPVGFISGALGIGGGTMLTPLLRRFVALRFAVGTSALCGLLMALGAVAINMLVEDSWRDVLADQLPFLLGAWVGIALILPASTGWSARLLALLPEETLRLILKTVFISLSASLVIAAAFLAG